MHTALNLPKSICRGCGQTIVWAMTEAGKRMPLDIEPNPDGNMTLILAGVLVARKAQLDETRYMPHHATCPEVGQFRKRNANH